MSMRCMTVPPRMNPSGLASFGRTTCTISVADPSARLAGAGDGTVCPAPSFASFASSAVSEIGFTLKVVADPHREARFAEFAAAAVGGEQHVFPLPVEQRAPRPVEVDREAEGEG